MDQQQYFAALPAEQLAGELQHRIDAYYQWILTTNRLSRWRTAYDTYYGQRGLHSSSQVTAAGEKGELSFLMSNEYRNLIQHLLVLGFQSRPSLDTVSINTDSTSKAQAYVGKGIIEYYRRDGLVDDNTKDAAEISLIMDTGWTFNEWDKLRGSVRAVDPDNAMKSARWGDIRSRARTPLDVVIDFTKPQGTERDWIMVRDPMNKYDLAAQYTEKSKDIIALERDFFKDSLYRFGEQYTYDSGFKSPDIDVWTFFHRKSPAMPEGRMFQFATSKMHFFDGPIPYRKLPGNRICPSEMILSALGYSNTNDLLSLQDVMDALISAAVTNMTSAGVNVIWTKDAADFDYEELAKGMSIISSAEKPEVLSMARLSPEWLALANFVIQRMQTLSGVNAVARGDTGGKDFSGAAMALLQSMAIQFNNGFVRSINRHIEDNGNDIIMLTQDFKDEPSLGMIIGENNKYMMKMYSGKDIKSIQRVYCRQSNPLKDTTAGKLQLLDKYMAVPGVITSAGQITEVIETGSLDSSTEQDRNSRLAMDQENEALIRGEEVPVVFTDDHPAHMKHLAKLFASPDDRKDPQLIARVRAHFEQHKMVWMQTDPATLMALGIPPFPAPMMMPPGAPPPGVAPAPGPGPSAGTAPPPADQQPGVPGPNMPQNPMTGEAWNPQTGGGPAA